MIPVIQLEEHQSMPPKRAPTNLDLADAKSITSDLLSLVSLLDLVAQGHCLTTCVAMPTHWWKADMPH